MDENLRTRWQHLLPIADAELATTFFVNLSKNYYSRKRHYHNVEHILLMLALSDEYAAHLQQKDIVDLAIFYHDVIYDPLRKDNEERSAQRAVRELTKLNVAKEKIERVETYIIATKTHDLQGFDAESDLAYFLDFDLSVLGADWETYRIYSQNIRNEYIIYPDFMYNPGRVKVLQHFLNKPTIYFTKTFQEKMDAKARENMKRELTFLKD